MFKGYIKTNGKKPIEQVKGNEQLYSYDGIRKLDIDYGGVLKDNMIMIDVDDKKDAKIVKQILEDKGIECNILKTTRGYHFYFFNDKIKSNQIGAKLAIGITADIKLGSKNTVTPIRVNGTTRRFISTTDNMVALPAWLTPIRYGRDFSSSNTRNNDLFTYILPLQKAMFTIDQIKETIEIINKYILDNPLDRSELDIILRDESFTKPIFFEGNMFRHDVFAKWLMQQYYVTKINSELHCYIDNEYINANLLNSVMLGEISQLKKNQRREVISYLEDYITTNKQQADTKYINMANGILNLYTMQLLDHTPDILITNKLPIKYVADAYDELCDKTLTKLANNDPNIRLLLEEMVGYCFLRRNELGKFFMLTGEGGCGKSTFLTMIQYLLGESNVSSISLQDLSDKFLKTDIVGKLANIGDDVSEQMIMDNRNLKILTTGERVQFENKGMSPFSFKNYAKLIFSCNNLPRDSDTSTGSTRRMIIVPFKANFTKDSDYNPYIIDQLISEKSLQYLFLVGVEGLKRVLKNRTFTTCEAIDQEIKAYIEYNNSVVGYIADGGQFENQCVNDSYLAYTIWCEQNGLKHVSKNRLSRELKNKYNISSNAGTKINGKTIKIYTKNS